MTQATLSWFGIPKPFVLSGVLAIGVFGFFSHVVAAAPLPLLEKLPMGEIDWKTKTLVMAGSGTPTVKGKNVAETRLSAELAAEKAAHAKLATLLAQVRLHGSEVTAAKLEQVSALPLWSDALKACKRQDTRYFADMGVDVVMRCPLDGVVTTLLSPQDAFHPAEHSQPKTASGLIVDASELAFRPCLFVKIVAEDGAILYARAHVSPGALFARGMLAYATSVDEAKRNERVGEKPIVVKAMAANAASGEIRLRKDDAMTLSGVHTGFLGDGRVVIVVKPGDAQ